MIDLQSFLKPSINSACPACPASFSTWILPILRLLIYCFSSYLFRLLIFYTPSRFLIDPFPTYHYRKPQPQNQITSHHKPTQPKTLLALNKHTHSHPDPTPTPPPTLPRSRMTDKISKHNRMISNVVIFLLHVWILRSKYRGTEVCRWWGLSGFGTRWSGGNGEVAE